MRTYYVKQLLARLLPELVHGQAASIKESIKQRTGKTAQFRRWESLVNTNAQTPLTEGSPGNGNSLTVDAVTATVAQYGDYVLISDMLQYTTIDPTIVETTRLLGEEGGQVIDIISREVLVAGTSVWYVNGRTARNQIAAGDVLTIKDIRQAVRILKNNNAKPLGGGWLCIISPDTELDLQSDPAWINVQQYARGGEGILRGEIGKMYGVRFVSTSYAKVFTGAGSGGVDVFATMVVGRGAFGCVDLAGMGKPKIIVKSLGSAGTADPLDQQSSVGWKAAYACARTQELAMVRIEHTVSQE